MHKSGDRVRSSSPATGREAANSLAESRFRRAGVGRTRGAGGTRAGA
ncbi:MAG TPA: hypothetical protein VGQ19_01115 [Burkholderiales bacterium]|nr:hypothetical protein [Burkholderiales bacterium]